MIELLPYLAGLAAVAGGFVAFGKLSARMTSAEARLLAVETKAETLQTAHHAAQAQLAKDLEAIRITLARIESTLSAMQRAA